MSAATHDPQTRKGDGRRARNETTNWKTGFRERTKRVRRMNALAKAKKVAQQVVAERKKREAAQRLTKVLVQDPTLPWRRKRKVIKVRRAMVFNTERGVSYGGGNSLGVAVMAQETKVRGTDGAQTDLEIDTSILPHRHRISGWFQDNRPPVVRFRLRSNRDVFSCVLPRSIWICAPCCGVQVAAI